MPGSANGVSVNGYQDLLSGVSGNSTYINIQFIPTVAVPPKRVGYLYLYQYNTTLTNDRRLILRNAIYLPAIVYTVPLPLFNSSFAYYAQAYWDLGGLSWTVSMN